MPKIPINPIMEGYLSALKSVAAKQAPKAAKKVARTSKPAAKKVAKRVSAVRPSRVEKTAANIRKSYPNLPEAEVMKRASMSKAERSAYLSQRHSAASAESAAAKAVARQEKQLANRAAWAEKNRAKMNRYESYKASNPTPVKKAAKKARSKKGAK